MGSTLGEYISLYTTLHNQTLFVKKSVVIFYVSDCNLTDCDYKILKLREIKKSPKKDFKCG